MKFLVLLLCAGMLGCAVVGGPGKSPVRDALPFPSPPLNLGSLPPPSLMEGIGHSRLEITTTSPQAQAYFNQGLSLLHGFWYFEAWRAFREAARLDSSCAMAYWGIHQSLRGNNSNFKAKKSALNKAKVLSGGASEHEQYYIHATAALDSLGRKGHSEYIRELEEVSERYPEDIEARLFLVRFVMHYLGFYGGPREGYPNRWKILRELLVSHPDHSAVHHYWVHAVEFGDHPEQGLESAEKLPRLAPNVAHIVHMPGHIYFRTGDYDRARHYFLAAAAVDSAYMVEQQIPVTQTWNYVHNLNYLLANYGEDGRYREGLQWALRMQQIPLDPRRTLYFYQGRMASVRLQLRYGFWEEAAVTLLEIAANDTLNSTFAEQYTQGLLAYSRGMAAVAKGDAEAAAEQAGVLGELEWQLELQESGGKDRYYSKRQVNVLKLAALDLKGSLHSLQGQHEEAFELLEEGVEKEENLGYSEPPRYARPVLESLGEAHLRAGNWERAREAFEQVMMKRPQSGHALYGMARSYALGGEEEEAARVYKALLYNWRFADGDLLQVEEAQAWLRAHGE